MPEQKAAPLAAAGSDFALSAQNIFALFSDEITSDQAERIVTLVIQVHPNGRSAIREVVQAQRRIKPHRRLEAEHVEELEIEFDFRAEIIAVSEPGRLD